MWIFDTTDTSISADTDAYYEAVASQEEIYLEETEEELRMILESDEIRFTTGGSLDEERAHARVTISSPAMNLRDKIVEGP